MEYYNGIESRGHLFTTIWAGFFLSDYGPAPYAKVMERMATAERHGALGLNASRIRTGTTLKQISQDI